VLTISYLSIKRILGVKTDVGISVLRGLNFDYNIEFILLKYLYKTQADLYAKIKASCQLSLQFVC
jgi:hypothetical protein